MFQVLPRVMSWLPGPQLTYLDSCGLFFIDGTLGNHSMFFLYVYPGFLSHTTSYIKKHHCTCLKAHILAGYILQYSPISATVVVYFHHILLFIKHDYPTKK